MKYLSFAYIQRKPLIVVHYNELRITSVLCYAGTCDDWIRLL